MTLKIVTPHIVSKIALFLLFFSVQINAQTATYYDFNTPGQLSSLFDGVGEVGSVSQLTTGGIGNSGGINLPSSANAIFSTKEGYSLGPAGSSDTFESLIQSVGNSGYSGVGFTASVPVSASSDGYYRPTDAIGISVHGGGFIFHNGATNYSGAWGGGLAEGITATKVSSAWDLLNTGSDSDWYKIIFKMTRATLSTFDLRVEIWISDANGAMLDTTAAAIFEVKGVTNTDLSNAPILHSYFNFSGYRVTNFDNFKVNLTGGGSIIQAGAPVVLTSSGTESNNIFTVNGYVASENGNSVTESGFVYATSHDPTITDNKAVSGSGLGTFSKSIAGLSAATTYYVRAYATNSSGTTSYGSELSFTTASIIDRYGGLTSDDISSYVNRYGEIGVSSLTKQGKEVFYVPKHSGAAVLVSSTETTANLTSTIATTGGKSITARGICWSTTPNPTTADNITVDGSGKGSFNSAITGLTKETTYYVRTYATNDIGTSYATEMSFTTPTLLAVGDTYQGGTIIQVSAPDGSNIQHGLIRTAVVTTNVNYNNTIGTTIPNANTNVLNGYSDWRMPNYSEAVKICPTVSYSGYLMSSTYTSYAPQNIEVVYKSGCQNSNLPKTYTGIAVVLVRSF